MATTIIINNYHDGVFRSTTIAGTFDNHDEAELFLNTQILFGGRYDQIAPCGYERLNTKGQRFEHVIITGTNSKRRDINGRWENA